MVELLLGLVSIMVLLLGIELIARIVYYDFITIYSAREEVAADLMAQSTGTSGTSTYDWDTVDQLFEDALNNNNTLQSKLDEYPGDRENAFDFLWDGDNPLQEMIGSERASSTPVTSPVLQDLIGRSSVNIENAIYMPPWEDLLGSTGGGSGN